MDQKVPKIHDPENPFDLFNEWFHEAASQEINDPNAMSLATVSPTGIPSVRMVLLKGLTDDQFVFYTNLKSRKAKEILKNPNVGLCFHWKSLHKQVRIEGICEQVSTEEANAYFSTRQVGSQIGAWASQQSELLENRAILEESLAKYALEFGDNPVPRPIHWSGFKAKPQLIEFWQEQPFRLHDRIVYTLDNEMWKQKRLYP